MTHTVTDVETRIEWDQGSARLVEHPNAHARRPHLLRTAERLVTGERNTTYDDPSVDFRRIAGLWSVYLGQDIEPHDVGALMALLKIARIRGNPAHADSWVDLAGYAACGYDCSPAEIGGDE